MSHSKGIKTKAQFILYFVVKYEEREMIIREKFLSSVTLRERKKNYILHIIKKKRDEKKKREKQNFVELKNVEQCEQ